MPVPDTARVLLLDEAGSAGDAAASMLAAAGMEVRRVPGGAPELDAALRRAPAELVVAVRAGAQEGSCADLRAACAERAGGCILVCPPLDAAQAVALMRDGALDVLTTDDLDRLVPAVERALRAVGERRAHARASDGLSALLRGAADVLAVIVTDAGGTVAEWGEGARRMLGHERDEVVGRADLTIGHDPGTSLDDLLDDAVAGAAAQRETWLTRRDGTRFPALWSVVPLRDAGGAIMGWLASARDVTRRQRAAEEHAALHRVATAVARESEPDVVFARIAREAATILAGDAGGVSRIGVLSATELGTWAREGVRGTPVGALTPLEGTSAVAVVARTGRGAHLADVWDVLDADTADSWGGLPGFRSVAACPVHVSGELWGALWVGSVAPEAFGAEDEERLARFAELAALAIANAEARERIVSDAIAGMFRGDLDVAGTLDLVVTAARRAMGADRATCYVHEDGAPTVAAVVTTETDPARRAVVEAVRGAEFANLPMWRMLLAEPSRTMVIEDVSATPEVPAELARRLDARAVVGIRLEHRSVGEGSPEHLGALFLSYRQPRRFSVRERAAAESLAGMAAVALANARLHAESLRSAGEVRAHETTDPLTGAANHRAFQERLTHEVTRAQRHRRQLSLALVDIDRFRRVNERHGHETGDRVLVEVAGLLRAAARDSDMVARVGGEEMAWLMPETDAMTAWQAVNRAREVVARMSIVSGMQVTVSAGVCDLARAGSAAELVRLTEGALYWAKQHGRDVAFLYSPAVVEELSAEERADRLARAQALQSIRVMARAVDAKDPSTLEHSQRVAALAVALATQAGWDAERLVRLREAGLVHDVGKIGVPDAILSKPARLTDAEYQEAKRHVSIGAEMVADVLTAEQVAWVRGHHEHWDGRGYPDGLAGDDIPDGARILALADAWDVMTSTRSYHEPLGTEQALAECRRCAGTQFAPEMVEVLAALVAAGTIAVPVPA